jgi:hypothetical protein
MRTREMTLLRILATCLIVVVVVAAGGRVAAQDDKPKSGTIVGKLESQKDTPDGKNTFIEVLAPGEERPRKFHVLYDEKAKGPIESVLAAVRAAKVGDRVEFDWVQTGHGPAIKAFKVLKKVEDRPKKEGGDKGKE